MILYWRIFIGDAMNVEDVGGCSEFVQPKFEVSNDLSDLGIEIKDKGGM